MGTISELSGYIASTLVLLTFMTKDMRLLRSVAIFSNIAFITYGALNWLPPVFCLHLLLLPLNILRLTELVRSQPSYRKATANTRHLLTALIAWPERRKVAAAQARGRVGSSGLATGRVGTARNLSLLGYGRIHRQRDDRRWALRGRIGLVGGDHANNVIFTL